MVTIEPYTLDVREELRNGGEPLGHILAAVNSLAPGQSLRLLTIFEPLPLYTVLAHKGFDHCTKHLSEGEWEVLFTPGTADNSSQLRTPSMTATRVDTQGWPPPSRSLDNRGLQPPEPLVRILEVLEHLSPGEVLEVFNERDPVFLYPELQARGAAIHTEKRDDGVYMLIRRRS